MEITIDKIIGKTVKSVTGEIGSGDLTLKFTDGTIAYFYHSQDCCEDVSIDDIVGDTISMVGQKLLKASIKVSENCGNTPKHSYEDDSYTWTFLTLATIKGYVDVKFYGSSNGYYGEDIDIGITDSSGTTTLAAYNNYQ